MLLSIILSVIPALVEESLFRGYLQRRFLQRWSPAVAISLHFPRNLAVFVV
jgi:membrane protease YdiL (CAAX protease family)